TRGARAPRRRRERAARPAGRSGGAGGGPRTARARRRAGAAALRQRARHLPGPGERGGARRALARPPGVAVLSARRLLWAAVAAYAAAFATLSVLRDRAFQTGRFDLGNMVQAVWSTAHGHPLRITELGGDQISRLAAHVDPILAVFAPLWWIWPSPDLLLVMQAIAIALGAVPGFWLARKHLGSEGAALGLELLLSLQRGRRIAQGSAPDGGHPSLDARREGLRPPRRALPDPARAATGGALGDRAARAGRRAAGSRDQPALGDADADVDPLPL